MDFQEFVDEIQKESNNRIQKLHGFANQLWKNRKWLPIDCQNKCLEAWDDLQIDLECKISPLVPVKEENLVTNLIFGSGSFTTGEFQAKQYNRVKQYAFKPPVILQGIVSNKSNTHGSNAFNVCKKYKVPLIELDFIDWFRENIDKGETNPIRASRYWFNKNDPTRPDTKEIAKRFKIRQNQFHKELGEILSKKISNPTSIASARGYNFQISSNIFRKTSLLHVNDTHPADLTFINPETKQKLYAGWQSGAVQMMVNDLHENFRSSLIEIEFMDTIDQIDELDEGVLLSLGKGVSIEPHSSITAKEIQTAMKIMDDNFFCTLEPTGLILLWGITDKKFPVVYHGLDGNEITVNQKLVIVGDKIRSGVNAWGENLEKDMKEIENFLIS